MLISVRANHLLLLLKVKGRLLRQVLQITKKYAGTKLTSENARPRELVPGEIGERPTMMTIILVYLVTSPTVAAPRGLFTFPLVSGIGIVSLSGIGVDWFRILKICWKLPTDDSD